MKRDRRLLLALWGLLGVLVAGISVWHPTQATSPDSAHYLRLATAWSTYTGIFPPGYSGLIWLVSGITSLPVLWASKFVNWLALGYFGWAWACRVGMKRAVFLLCIWLLPGNLRLLAYTWSETLFIVLLLETVWTLNCLQVGPTRAHAHRMVGLLVALVWVRYVGLFLVLAQWSIAVRRTAVRRTVSLNILLGIAPLILLNHFLTGHPFGGPRLLPTEAWPELLNIVSVAALNEVLLYDYRPGRQTEFVGFMALVQALEIIIAICWLRRTFIGQSVTVIPTPLARRLFGVGLAYFLTLFVLRTISPFDPLNERLMAPGSVCWLVALVISIQSQHSIISRSPERADTFTNPS
ncbi:MAG: hypothetical protein LH609_05625 [Rudanella sp.]|nr:hypothetical protein [Rudanella sp.]